MNYIDVFVLILIVAVIGGAVWAMYRSKKSGKKCIGCPDSCACSGGNCSGKCNATCPENK